MLARHVRPGTTVVLESTTYPGTTEELAGPILEERSGWPPAMTSTSATAPSASTRATPSGAWSTRPRWFRASTLARCRRCRAPDEVAAADAVVLLVDHDTFDLAAVERHSRYVLDTRNRVRGSHVEHL